MMNATDAIVKMIKGGQNRLLKMYFPNDDGPDAGLLINHLTAEEVVSKDFTFTITALSDDAHIDLDDMHGKMICVELTRADQSVRYFNGYCFACSLLRVDNGLAVYEIILKPWLALFAERNNFRVFHHQSILEQTKQIFCETGLARHDFRLAGEDSKRTFSCQYDESNYNYLHRRWEELGWLYWYEHSLDGHRLIISDNSCLAMPIDGNPRICFHHDGGMNKQENISCWSPIRKNVIGKISLSSFDFKQARSQKITEARNANAGDVYPIESYHYAGLYNFADAAHGKVVAKRMVEQSATSMRSFFANSDSRAVQVGRWFRFDASKNGNALHSQQNTDFFIHSALHQIDNNYLNSEGGSAQYHNQFSCATLKIPFRPAQGFNSRAIKIAGIDTAIVVGPPGQDIHTDNFGRVKVHFHWDKEGGDEQTSSAWLRVASNWAGGELGSMALPRIGSEVLVQWLAGSPDRPIITGSVYNARKMPPWKLPAQQALMGIRSRELGGAGNAPGGRSNACILDDTKGKIQAQLKSDHQSSQLSLGYITRIDRNIGRQEARGEGWELASHAWGVARAAKGLLITTEALKDAATPAKQMSETILRLEKAGAEHGKLADLAEKYGAQQELQEKQSAIAEVIRAQAQALKGTGEATFPELTAPHLVLASPAGIEASTAKSMHLATGQHLALTTGKNLSIVSGENVFASIKKTFRLFVQRAGMKMIAAAGDIDIQALSNSIQILAKLNISQTANRITITAEDEVVINGGGSYAKFSASGIETGTKGSHTAHAATHSFVAAKALKKLRIKAMVPKKVEPDIFDEAFQLKNEDTGELLVGVRYRIKRQDGRYEDGRTDEHGQTHLVSSEAAEKLEIEVIA